MKNYQVKIQDATFSIEFANSDTSKVLVNGTEKMFDVYKTSELSFHVTKDHVNYSVEVLKVNKEEKKVTIRVNGNKYECELNTSLDLLLKEMGFDALASKKIKELKAPMPGLVLEVIAKEGLEVKKGDALIILEAMKMENMIKAAGDGIVKKIHVIKGNAVEKSQVLITFE